MPRLDAGRATWNEVADAYGRGAIPVLPFGAHEQHGPHLPLQTDTMMAEEIAGSVADAVNGILLPAVAYGETSNNAGFAGTVSLSFETVEHIVTDVATALRRSGARGLIVVNGDFGNLAPITRAARRAGQEYAFPVLVVDYPGLADEAALHATTAPAAPHFYHADEVETSIILSLEPGAVHLDRAVAEYPVFPPAYPQAFTGLENISTSGVFGDPRPATAETGRAILGGVRRQAVELAEAFVAERL